MALDQRHRLLQHRHHPEAEQIDLHDPEIGAVVLVPLHDHPPGHARRLQRHDGVQAAGGDHHAARVLAEVARQVQEAARHLADQAVAVLRRREAGRRQVGLDRLVAGHQPDRQVARDAIELLLGEAERAPRVAHRHARPVGDHVRGHGGAARAVAFVHVLDHQLALIARRQIQIDVGHPVGGVVGGGDALLRQEAFEQQIHPHRIDGGDAEDVADGGVRGRAPPLHHDPARPREPDDVPDDQEVAGRGRGDR